MHSAIPRPSHVQAHGHTSLLELGERQLESLCRATGNDVEQALHVFRDLSTTWGGFKRQMGPAWPTDVSNDHTPFELSVAFDQGQPELRVMVEAYGHPPSAEGNRAAAMQLTEVLATRYGAGTRRLRQLEELFLPKEPQGLFSMWHAVIVKKGQPLSFKAYLNPQVRGHGERAALIQQALERLGFDRAWPTLADLLTVRGAQADEIVYLALDLGSSDDARVKIYFRHHAATLEHLESTLSIIPTVKPGEVSRFCTLLSGSTGPFLARPIITCFSLTNSRHSHPSAGTVYLPIGNYVTDDAQARERNRECLAHYGLDVETYDRILKELPERPLNAGVGMHVYTSLRLGVEKPRVTLYFGPEAYKTFPPRVPGTLAVVPAVKPAADLCDFYEAESAAAHPFFQRLAREPVSLERLWLLMTNIGEGIVKEFPRWLAQTIAKVPDDRIRCVLVKQLHDELGEGDYQRAHKPMFEQMLRQLDAWRWKGEPASLLAPGTRMRARLDEILSSENPYECVGSLMIFEIYGKQFDLRIGDEFRRQAQLDTRSLGWLNLHETLEVDHASEISTLAALLPDDDAVRAAWRGAERTVAASDEFLNGLYRLCFA